MNNNRQHGIWKSIVIIVPCLMIIACSTTRYVWKNSDSYKSTDAQLRKDAGECTMLSHQSIPALPPPQGQNINQNVTVNPYMYGRSNLSSTLQALNQQLEQQRQQQQQLDYQRNQQMNAQRQLKKSREEFVESCMASKGWYQIRVNEEKHYNQNMNPGLHNADCETSCRYLSHDSGYCRRMCDSNPDAY